MRGLVYTGEKGTPLAWQDIAVPELIAPGDALVKPLAVAACDLDRSITSNASPFPGPFVLGHEFTGEVMGVGAEVAGFKPGDRVLVSFQPSCGHCSRCGFGHTSVCASVPNGTMYGIGPSGGDWGGAITDLVRVPWADANLVSLGEHLDARALASASDNLADGVRTVAPPLKRRPGASVLVAGAGSIALYAVLTAKFLGAEQVTLASKDRFVLDTAANLGATCLDVADWPQRFQSHDITVDCTNDVAGLAAVLRSTEPYGECTSASIFFGGDIALPMFNLNMRGITFHTGRVNSAASMQEVLGLVSDGLNPDAIDPAYWPLDDAIEALQTEPYSRKLILWR